VVCNRGWIDQVSLAVFANGNGAISLAVEVNGQQFVDEISIDQGFDFVKIVSQALTDAVPIKADLDASYAEHLRKEARSMRFRLILGGK